MTTYTLKLRGNDTRLLDIPAGTQVAVDSFATRLGVTDSRGLESTIELPAVSAIIDQYGEDVIVASGTVLHGETSDDANAGRELVRVPVLRQATTL